MLKAIWNNFYNAVVRNVSPALRGGIIFVLFVGAILCLVAAIKGGKEGKPIKNWFMFWVGIFLVIIAIAYTIIQSL